MKDTGSEHQVAIGHKNVVERLWTEPAFEQCRKHLPKPPNANVLVAEARCGMVPIKWIEDLPETTRVMALDSSSAMLDTARQRIGDDLQRRIFFVQQRVSQLSYADGVFPAAICLSGIVTARQAQEGLGELTRVTSSGGQVVICAPLATSFPEFYDLLDEALRAHGLADALGRLNDLRNSLLSPARLLDTARSLRLTDINVSELSWNVAFGSGREFLYSPLVQESFFPHWVGAIRSSEREPVLRYIGDAIDTYWHERMMRSTITACMLKATKI
ncbi:MAG: methyltransferase domain-containing protein [Bradymonadaceae bacterium]|nr:methyltransferase domain-containing protein [Lujinxingiaceae bacterium]